MARTSVATLRRIRTGHPSGIVPRVFVETGTLRAETAMFAHRLYSVVETIELSEDLYREAVRIHGQNGIRFHHGDSVEVLPQILARYQEPVCVYLDAHWFDRSGIVGRERFPLWDELALVAERPFADIVVVDDVHSFGTSTPCADWMDVTEQTVLEALDPERVLDARVDDDHFVVYRR